MTRDEFEQLVSEWIDQPQAALDCRIRSAMRSRPDFAQVRDQWLEFESQLRARLPHMKSVAWDRFQGRVADALREVERRA